MPPYALPEHKSRTVFKSMSTPGGDGPRGFNELRVEDKAGEEEIYLHAEKDVNVHVKNDWKEHMLRDRHLTVDRHVYVQTGGETHETLDKDRKTELRANDNLTVRATSHTAIDGSWLRRVGVETHLYAGENAVFEAGTSAILRGGASWIRLDPAGVGMGGASVSLGGGAGGGDGPPADPLLPVTPEMAGLFSEYFIVKANGKPLPNVHYAIILEDNSILSGITDKYGKTVTVVDKEKKSISILFDQGFPVEIA